MIRKTVLALSAGALTVVGVAGIAYAQQSPRMKMDTDGNGSVTRAEAQAHSGQMFARLDANKDGKLDTADRAARRTARFDALDTDKNGQISRAEFDAARAGRMGRRMAGGMANGMESHRGGKHGMGGGGHGRRGGGGMMMGMAAMADANKDSAVSRAEFDAATTQHFTRVDTDRNGEISTAERQAARAAMREQWRARRVAPATAAPAAPATGT